MSQSVTMITAFVYLSILAMFYRQLIHRKLDNTFIDVMNQLAQESAILNQSAESVAHSSQQIQTINNVINDIAYQTNILSLNAMIEASRADSASGGFKVVALEVKRLAERSASAVENINKLLDNNFRNVQESVNHASAMKHKFHDISQSMQPLVTTVQNVTDASIEQHEAIRQITLGIEDIDRAVDNNKELATLSSTTAQELKRNASSLLGIVDTLQSLIKTQQYNY